MRTGILLTACALGALGVEAAPLPYRLLTVAALLCAGAWGWWTRRRFGAFLVSLGIAWGWIVLGSYPASLGFVPRWIWATALPIAVCAPWLVCVPRPAHPRWAHVFPLALSAWVALTPPARRYDVGHRDPDLAVLAAGFSSPAEAVAHVHTAIARKKAPLTDTASDTLRRGHAHCGGMSNLLHALLQKMGIDAVIVHARGEKPGHIHTLVELRWEGRIYLADPQENILLPGDITLLLRKDPDPAWPPVWRNMRSVYRHVPGRGYRRVSAQH